MTHERTDAMDTMALQDAGVGAVGGFFVALLVLYRLVGPSDADYERVPVARRWRIRRPASTRHASRPDRGLAIYSTRTSEKGLGW